MPEILAALSPLANADVAPRTRSWLREAPGGRLVVVRGAAAAELGTELGGIAGRSRRAGDTLAWSLRPGELMVLNDGVGPAAAGPVEAVRSRYPTGWTDLTHGVALMRLDGALAPRILAKLCPLDLARLVDDTALRTSMAQVIVEIITDDASREAWLLVVPRSYAVYFSGVLDDAGTALLQEAHHSS